MTTLTTNEIITNGAFVRQVIGYAKAGMMIHPSVRAMGLEKFEQLTQQEGFEPQSAQTAARVLEQMRTGLLPQEQLCRQAMTEIEQFLLPMQRDRRVAEAAGTEDDDQPVRERQRG
jgi:hypothetical protein